jgi:glycosyltransferase involved in cell wall biosynthesis
MKIVSINTLKSVCPGGIESLIRAFKDLSSDAITGYIELYNQELEKELYEQNADTSYINYLGRRQKFFKKWHLRSTFNRLQLKGNVIVIFHVSDLLALPKKTKQNNKIVVVQTNRFDIFFTSLGKIAVSLMSKDIDIFTVYTDKDRKQLNQLYPQLSNITKVIPRGCRLDTADEPPTCTKKLVTITRLHEDQKNLSGMVEIVASMSPDFTLDIYGHGEESEINYIEEITKEHKNIKFCGPAVDVKDILSRYSVFLMTSHYEGFGQTLIEARSQGLPIVCYNTFDAASFIIESGNNGYLVPFEQQEAFVKRIKQITESECQYDKFAKKSLELAKNTERSLIEKEWMEVIHG